MTRWPSGEKSWSKRHAGEVADDLALPGLDVEEIDLRIALAELHIGDLLRVRREARRQHEVGAAGQIAHIGAVLVHHREPLDAALLRPGLVHEHHAAVEIALLTGHPLIDLVGDDVRDAAPIFRRGEILLARELLAGDHVPQAEFGLEPAIGLPRHPAGDQRLRVDGLPVLELRRDVDIVDALDEGRLVDRRKQARALQIVGDDLRDAIADVGVGRRARQEVGDRDRDRLKCGRVDAEPILGEGTSAPEHREPRSGQGHEAAAVHRSDVIHRKILLFGCHNISFRPKVIGMVFQLSYCCFGMNE